MNVLADIKFSLEMMPNHLEDFLDSYKQFQTSISKDQFQIFITHVNKTNYADILLAAKELTQLGFSVIPHLAIRNIKEGEKIDEILSNFNQTQIKQLLLLGGDNSETIHFQSAKEFLNFHQLNQYGFETIYLPTFPEGHPHIAIYEDSLNELFSKYQIVKNQNISVSFISQICLDQDLLSSHLTKLCSMNPNIPISIGYIAPIKTSKLIKIAANIGLSNIVSFLTQGKLFQLLKAYDSDELVNQLITNHKIDALHCYAFGNYTGSFEKMIRYQTQIEQKNLEILNKKEVK